MDWTEEQFGVAAALRYDRLLAQALKDIGADPERAGVQHREDIGDSLRLYHLRFSRSRAAAAPGRVGRPRHYLVFRCEDGYLELLRVIHDSRDVQRHVE